MKRKGMTCKNCGTENIDEGLVRKRIWAYCPHCASDLKRQLAREDKQKLTKKGK